MRVELLQGAEADLLEAYVRLDEKRAGLGLLGSPSNA